MYFGGIWGGQLQRWYTGTYDKSLKTDLGKDPEPALNAKVVRMSKNMLTFDEPVKDVKIIDKDGKPLLAGDHDRRFFEGAWMHKYKGKYYFSYSDRRYAFSGITLQVRHLMGHSPTKVRS